MPVTRTSLIVDPPEGKLPPLTAAAQKRINDARIERQRRPADGPEDRPLMDRCLWWPAVGPPMLPSFANNSPVLPAGQQLSVPAGLRLRRHRQRDPSRDARHSHRRAPPCLAKNPQMDGRRARSLGGEYADRRHHEFHGEEPVPGNRRTIWSSASRAPTRTRFSTNSPWTIPLRLRDPGRPGLP